MMELEYQFWAIEEQRRADIRKLQVARHARRLNPNRQPNANPHVASEARSREPSRAPSLLPGRES